MTDTKALREFIDDSGMKIKSIAEKSGILRETLYKRLDTGDFKLSEICALMRVLHMDNSDRDRIFFPENSE